jgi:hypothetical protein
LDAKNDQLQRANYSESARKFDKPPIGFRFFGSLLAVCFGFLASLWGWKYFDHGRKLLGAALIGGGSLLGIGGFLLWGFWV